MMLSEVTDSKVCVLLMESDSLVFLWFSRCVTEVLGEIATIHFFWIKVIPFYNDALHHIKIYVSVFIIISLL